MEKVNNVMQTTVNRWKDTAIGAKGRKFADSIAPYIEEWLDDNFDESIFPGDLAYIVSEVVRQISFEMGLYKKHAEKFRKTNKYMDVLNRANKID